MPKPRKTFIISVEGVVWRDGQYLTIVRGANVGHAAGMLAFPGGGVEMHDERMENVLEENVRREVMEETGVQIEPQIHYMESIAFISDEGYSSVHTTFLCLYKAGDAHIASPREVGAVQWMTADEIINEELAPSWIKDSIHLAEKKRRELGW